MTIQVLDPSSEMTAAASIAAPRLSSLAGCTVGFISNGKEGTIGFFDHLDRLLKTEFGVSDVVMRVKSNYSAPADPQIVAEIAEWDAVISGIGDWGSCSSCSLHDAVAAERLGVPAIGVMTTQFVSAAELMCRVLGMPEYTFAVIDHPVSSAGDEGLAAMAQSTIVQARTLLLA